jgi:hypothetical protein
MVARLPRAIVTTAIQTNERVHPTRRTAYRRLCLASGTPTGSDERDPCGAAESSFPRILPCPKERPVRAADGA